MIKWSIDDLAELWPVEDAFEENTYASQDKKKIQHINDYNKDPVSGS